MSLRSHKMPRRIILFKWNAERDIAHLSLIKERYGSQVTMSLIKYSQVLQKVQAPIKLEGQWAVVSIRLSSVMKKEKLWWPCQVPILSSRKALRIPNLALQSITRGRSSRRSLHTRSKSSNHMKSTWREVRPIRRIRSIWKSKRIISINTCRSWKMWGRSTKPWMTVKIQCSIAG